MVINVAADDLGDLEFEEEEEEEWVAEAADDSDSDDDDDDDDGDDDDDDDDDDSDDDDSDDDDDDDDNDDDEDAGEQKEAEAKTEEPKTAAATARAQALSSDMMATLMRLKQMYPLRKRSRRAGSPMAGSSPKQESAEKKAGAPGKESGAQQAGSSAQRKFAREAVDSPKPPPVMADFGGNTETAGAGLVVPNRGVAQQRLQPPSPFRYGLTGGGDESGYMSSDSMDDGRVGLLKPAAMASSSPQSRMQRRHLRNMLGQGQGGQQQQRQQARQPRQQQEFTTAEDVYRGTRNNEAAAAAAVATTAYDDGFPANRDDLVAQAIHVLLEDPPKPAILSGSAEAAAAAGEGVTAAGFAGLGGISGAGGGGGTASEAMAKYPFLYQ